MPSVGVYQLKNKLFVHPWNKTTMGLGIATEPYVSLPSDAQAAALGEVILSALTESGHTVQHPTDWKSLAGSRLKAAGVKSERAFQLETRYVSVKRGSEGYAICPSRNGGSKGDKKGFEPLPDSALTIPLDSVADQIGAAILEGLKKCA